MKPAICMHNEMPRAIFATHNVNINNIQPFIFFGESLAKYSVPRHTTIIATSTPSAACGKLVSAHMLTKSGLFIMKPPSAGAITDASPMRLRKPATPMIDQCFQILLRVFRLPYLTPTRRMPSVPS